MSSSPPDLAIGQVSRDATNPRSRLLWLSQIFTRLPCRKKGFLSNILAQRHIAADAVSHTCNRRLMTSHKFFERH
jgi:hypothetical protein